MRDTLRGKSVLVTGAAGFIGAHLVARLSAEGASVSAVVQPGSTGRRLNALGVAGCAVTADLSDPAQIAQAVARAKPDLVYHLAAERNEAKLIAQPEWSATTGAALIEACTVHRIDRFVTIGSSLEIPDPLTGQPTGSHGLAKARAMQAMQAKARQTGVPFSALRTHYVYGPLHGPQKLIPMAIRAAASGEPMQITDATITKRFVYVLDMVEACLQVLDIAPDPEVVFLTTADTQHTNLEVIERIGTLLGKQVTLADSVFPARGWDRESWDIPAHAATPLPGWSAQTDLDQGLRATIAEVLQDAQV